MSDRQLGNGQSAAMGDVRLRAARARELAARAANPEVSKFLTDIALEWELRAGDFAALAAAGVAAGAAGAASGAAGAASGAAGAATAAVAIAGAGGLVSAAAEAAMAASREAEAASGDARIAAHEAGAVFGQRPRRRGANGASDGTDPS